MVVELKKVKITKSVVDQSLMGNSSLYFGSPHYDILGWCLTRHKGSPLRYILLYDKVANTVVKLRHVVKITDVEMKETNSQERGKDPNTWVYPKRLVISLYFSDWSNAQIIRTQTDAESDEDMKICFDKLRQFLRSVYSAGQIYI